jgi:thiol-disulfide isomerase/thioredoxin
MRAAIRTRRGRLAAWAAGLAVLAVLLAVGLAGKHGANDRPAPALPAGALAGRPVTLAALLGGGAGASGAGLGGSREARGRAGATHRHAALVIFWASWCEPCQHEAPAVERFAQSAAGRGRVVGVDYGESELSGPRAFVHRYRWTIPVLLDPDARAGEAYGVTSLPNIFAIDARGRIVRTLRGPQTEQSLTQALAAASSS